jgi:hypothetical protein
MILNIVCTSVVDPNPKESESFGWIRIRKKFGFGFRHSCKMKICVKNRRSNTWTRKILCFSIKKILFTDVQVPEHVWKQLEAPVRKIWVQNISLRIRIRIRIRKKILWIRIRKNEFGSTTLVCTVLDPNPYSVLLLGPDLELPRATSAKWINYARFVKCFMRPKKFFKIFLRLFKARNQCCESGSKSGSVRIRNFL